MYDPLDSTWEWSACRDLITVPFERPYAKYASASDGRIGLAFTDGHPRDIENNIYYAEIRVEGGAAAFFRADGTRIKGLSAGPLLRAEADTVFDRLADPGVTGGNAMVWDLAFDEDDLPVVAFVSFPGRDHHQYHWARFDGSSWEDDIVVRDAGGSESDTTIGAPEYYTSGGIALDKIDPGVIYVSVENWHGGFDIDQMRRDDSGPSWSATAITEAALCDNLRPIVPANRPADLQMVLWVSGPYSYWKNTPDGGGHANRRRLGLQLRHLRAALDIAGPLVRGR
jgi:hypothetical protein